MSLEKIVYPHTLIFASVVVFLLSLLTLTAHAQNRELDSLVQVLNSSQQDTARIKNLNTIIEAGFDPSLWKKYNDEMLALTSKGELHGKMRDFYLRYQSNGLNNKAFLLETSGDTKAALDVYQKSLAISTSLKYDEGISTTLSNMGYVYKELGDIPNALRYYTRALLLKQSLHDDSGVIILLNNIGLIYYNQGNISAAMEHYQKSLRLAETSGNKKQVALSLNNMAGIYHALNERSLQMDYVRRSLKAFEELGNKPGIAQGNLNLGTEYMRSQNYQQAIACFDKALQLYNEMGMKRGVGSALAGLGGVYRETGDFLKSLDYYQQSLTIGEELNRKESVAANLNRLGEVHALMGHTRKAIDLQLRSLAASQSIGVIEVMRNAADELYKLYKITGESDKALNMHELFISMRDSIEHDADVKEAMRSYYQREYERKAVTDSVRTIEEKKVIAAELKQQKTQRFVLILGIIFVITVAAFLIQRARIGEKIKELRLRNKIASDLHDDVGSALSSISLLAGVARVGGGRAGEGFAEKIEITSRETIENMNDIVWSLQPRFDSFSNVLSKMKSFGDTITSSAGIAFSFMASPAMDKVTLDMEHRKNLYLIYKEAVNNAVKYSKSDTLNVSVEKDHKNISLWIRDNGVGFTTDILSSGNGMTTMRQRAAEINGALSIHSGPGKGTEIHLTFKA